MSQDAGFRMQDSVGRGLLRSPGLFSGPRAEDLGFGIWDSGEGCPNAESEQAVADSALPLFAGLLGLICALGLLFPWATQAAEFDYGLQARQVAADTWVFVGAREDFSPKNGGNIVNTGFIVTREGVVVIDTGPSLRYGRQMRAAIAKLTPLPIKLVLNTHHHPDHFLGNQAFADLPILALPETAKDAASDGPAFNDNMYRMAGDWMRDTEVLAPRDTAVPERLSLGGHELVFLRLAGHTHADLALLDQTTGVLFSGDLVFHDRAPTTPHADIPVWLKSLDALAGMKWTVLVPGHGEPSRDAAPIAQTRDWLVWLSATLRDAARQGQDMAEVLRLPLPNRFSALPLAKSEYTRSVSHLFPGYEREVLR